LFITGSLDVLGGFDGRRADDRGKFTFYIMGMMAFGIGLPKPSYALHTYRESDCLV